ncbi:MAG: hypothetical protein DRG80_01400, partial [Deltaproteobacteria bacterium]
MRFLFFTKWSSIPKEKSKMIYPLSKIPYLNKLQLIRLISILKITRQIKQFTLIILTMLTKQPFRA